MIIESASEFVEVKFEMAEENSENKDKRIKGKKIKKDTKKFRKQKNSF